MITLLQHLQLVLSAVLSHLDVFKNFNLVNWTRGLIASFRPALLPAAEPRFTLPSSLAALELALDHVDLPSENLSWPSTDAPSLVSQERHPLVYVIAQLYQVWMPQPTYELRTPSLLFISIFVLGTIVGLAHVSPWRLFHSIAFWFRGLQRERTSATASPAAYERLFEDPVAAHPTVVPPLESTIHQHSSNLVTACASDSRRLDTVDSSSFLDVSIAISSDVPQNSQTPVAERKDAYLVLVEDNSVEVPALVLDREISQEGSPDVAGTDTTPLDVKGVSQSLSYSNVMIGGPSKSGIHDDNGSPVRSRPADALGVTSSTVAFIQQRSHSRLVDNTTDDFPLAGPSNSAEVAIANELDLAPRTAVSIDVSSPVTSPPPDTASNSSEARENLSPSLLPADYKCASPVPEFGRLFGEPIGDLDWALINVTLNEEHRVVITETLAAKNSSASSSGSISSLTTEQACEDRKDHCRLGSAPSRLSVPDKPKATLNCAPCDLTVELAAHWPSVSSRLGLIVHDRTAHGLYAKAAYQLALMEEKEGLRLAAVHSRPRRASSVDSRNVALPSGYGLSQNAFLSTLQSLVVPRDKSYAKVSLIGLNPSPSPSPARVETVLVHGSLQQAFTSQVSELTRRPSFITINKNRGSLDVNVNGVTLQAELPRPLLRSRLSSGVVNLSSSRTGINSLPVGLGQTSRDVPGACPSRMESSVLEQPTRARSNSLQSNAVMPSELRQFDNEHSRATSHATTSPSTSPILGSRQSRPVQYDVSSTTTPLHATCAPVASSPVTPSSGSFLPASNPKPGRRRESIISRPALETIVGSPTASPPRTIMATTDSTRELTPSMDAVAQAIMQSPKIVYPRVDDDDALKAFERDLRVV